MGRRGPLPGADKAPAAPAAKLGPVPPAPAWLGQIARDEYARVVREKPDLTAADAGLLTSYAQAFGEIALHTKALDGDPAAGIAAEGYTVKGDRGCVLNPRVRALDRARVGLLAAAQALGLSITSRIRNGEAPTNLNPTAGPEDGQGPA